MMKIPVGTEKILSFRFKCAFSEKAIKYNTIEMLIVVVPTIIVISYLFITTGLWAGFILVFFLLAVTTYSMWYISRLTKESYLEITDDGRLECTYKGRVKISYPISEIESIEEASLEQAEKKYAKFPVTLNTRGRELYPERGVLVTFNRSWIKSVFPVYFNPVDINGFVSAIKQTNDIHTQNLSTKTEE